jgi:threonine aldolase
MAAAGIYALENHIQRLSNDHQTAKEIEQILNESELVKHVLPVETNIVVFELNPEIVVNNFIEHLKRDNILAFQVGPAHIRFVTHLDVPEIAPSIIQSALLSYSSSSSAVGI